MSAVDEAAELLASRIGMDADAVGRHVIASAVTARRTALQLDDAAYRAALARPGELERLVEEAVVPESWFGREPAALAYLLTLARSWCARGSDPFRLLCVPCARGEEACSAVIALVQGGIPAARIDVLAIDVSARHIAHAREGCYGARALRGFSSPHLWREDERWTVAPEIRAAIRYRVGNVLDERMLADEPPFQAALCRNLLIYLTPAARTRCLSNIHRALDADGVLCSGSAEAIAVHDARFRSVGPAEAVAFRGAGASDPPPAAAGAAPAPALAPIDRAVELADAGELDAALTLLQPHLSEEPPDPRAVHLAGVIYGARGNWRQAEVWFGRLLLADPLHDDALRRMALICERRGDPIRAEGFRQRAAAVLAGRKS